MSSFFRDTTLVTLAFQPQMAFAATGSSSKQPSPAYNVFFLLILAAALVVFIKHRSKSKRLANLGLTSPRLSGENPVIPLYLWLNRKAEGPFPMGAIQNFYREGRITSQTFARRQKGEN